LGPNGGSKTIIKSAETLNQLGHGSIIWSPINNYIWHKPNVVIETTRDANLFNAVDCIVNVSVWDVQSTIDFSCNKCNNKVWYLRGWEAWVKGEQYLIDQIKKFVNAGGRMICNSSWLINQLKEKCNVESVLCWSGLDLDFWRPHTELRYDIGFMKYKRHETKRNDLMENIAGLRKVKSFEVNIKSNLDDYKLRCVYSDCKMWFCPTENEGFHNVGAEANLCGCLIFCNRMQSNGMSDYATEETAERFSDWDELLKKLSKPDFDKIPKMQKLLKEKIGSRETNMKRFVKMLEEK